MRRIEEKCKGQIRPPDSYKSQVNSKEILKEEPPHIEVRAAPKWNQGVYFSPYFSSSSHLGHRDEKWSGSSGAASANFSQLC